MKHSSKRWLVLVLVLAIICVPAACIKQKKEKIGVLYILHGGMDVLKPQYLWDASLHQFSYDHNHPVYQMVIWNPDMWPAVLQTEFAVKFLRKYEFQYPRIGGTDPFHALSNIQMEDMKAELNKNPYGMHFEVEFVSWMSADRPQNYPYPRFIYNGPQGAKAKCTYCGEQEADGPWQGCDPERYNIDGPVERLLKKGVSRIIAIDTAVGGVRFYKPFDVVQMSKRVLNKWNQEHGTSIPLLWVNDYSNLMERSYPIEPEGWTSILRDPVRDSVVLLKGSPNPVASDPDLAILHVEGIEAGMSDVVPDAQTGVILFNHGLFDPYRAYFDPKIDDTNVLNENIKKLLLERHPDINPANIIGAYGGSREINPENNIYERTRRMRGEDLAFANLHQSKEQLPPDPWGYRYWDALEYLKNRGVKHIVIAFSQVVTDSVLTLVEYYNQIGKEIGVKTWLYYAEGDFDRYPEVGHPFADYWGNWVETDCGGIPCCFTMGGCEDGRPYPPPRQTPLNQARNDMDPSLAFDLSDYGHLGYDPATGPPDPNGPVQDQYTGTWEVYTPPSADPRVGKLLAKHVLNAAVKPLVYITNGEVDSIRIGQSITWQATVVSGIPNYSYEWYIKREGDADWTSVGDGSAVWVWTPGEAGTYAVRCKATDAKLNFAEVTWEGFVVSVS